MSLPLTVCLLPGLASEQERDVSAFQEMAAELLSFEPVSNKTDVRFIAPSLPLADEALLYEWGQQAATQPWILYLKVTEQLSPESLHLLPELLQSDADVILVRCHQKNWGLEGIQARLVKRESHLKWSGSLYPEPRLTAAHKAHYGAALLITENGPPVTTADREARLQQLQQAADQSPLAKTMYHLGLEYFALQQDQQAEAAFTDYMQQIDAQTKLSKRPKPLRIVHIGKPESGDFYIASCHLYLAKIKWEAKDYAGAYDYLLQWSLRLPLLECLPGLWVMRGVMARHYQEQDMAIACFQKALSLYHEADFYPTNKWVAWPDVSWKPHMGIAEIYFEQGRFLQAYHAYQAALPELPDHPYVLSGLAKCCFLLKKYTELQHLFDNHAVTLLGISPEIAQAVRLVVQIHTSAATPNLSKQLETLEAPLIAYLSQEQTVPSFEVSVLFDYAVTLLKQGYSHLARPVLSIVSQLLPHIAAVWHNLGTLALNAQEYEQANTYYQIALQLNPKLLDSLIDLAKIAVLQGDVELARLYFQQVLEQYPAHRWVKQALAQLQGIDLNPVETLFAKEATVEPAPFIFIFPLPASWEHGGDIVLKAYLEEFVATDHVALAMPKAVQNPLVEQAFNWASQRFTPELLPPIIWLEEALDLIPGYSAWVLPTRLPLQSQVVQHLYASGYPALLPIPSGSLPVRWLKEPSADENSGRCWHEVTVRELSQSMRALWRGRGDPKPHPPCTTHLLLAESQTEWTAPLAWYDVPAVERESTSVSVCMMVKNEAHFLEPLLHQLIDEADEIVVVDTGSTDGTLEILQRYPQIRLLQATWQEDFAAMRNFTLSQAQSDWVFMLDADERLPTGFWPAFRRQLRQAPDDLDAFVFPIMAVDETGQENLAESLLVPRAFRRLPCYHYVGLVHEMLVHQEKEKMNYYYLSDLPLWHLGYQPELKQSRDKDERYFNLMLQNLEDSPESPHVLRFYLAVGQIYQGKQKWDEAETYYRRGLALNPTDQLLREGLFKGLIHVLIMQQQWQAACESLSQTVYSDGDTWLLKGLIEQHQGHLLGALSAYETALTCFETESFNPRQLKPTGNRLEVLLALFQIQEAMGNTTAAIYWLQRALKIQPEAHGLWKQYERLQAVTPPPDDIA